RGAVGWPKLRLGDAVGVQAAGDRSAIENRDAVTAPAQLRRAGERSRSGPDARHAVVVRMRGRRQAGAVRVEPVHRGALQAAYLDGFLVVALHHARAF